MNKTFNVSVLLTADGDFSDVSFNHVHSILGILGNTTSDDLIKINNSIYHVLHNEIDMNKEYMEILFQIPVKANSVFEAEYIASYMLVDATLDTINLIDCHTDQVFNVKIDNVRFECEVFDDVA